MPSQQPGSHKLPSWQAIVRAVASSTAIETGQRVAALEARLRERKEGKFPHLSLARSSSFQVSA